MLTEGIPDAAARLVAVTADAAAPGAMGNLVRELLTREPNLDAVLFNHGTTVFTEDGDDIVVARPWEYSPLQMCELVQVNALSVWEGLHELGKAWANPAASATNAARRRAIALVSSSGALNPDVFDPEPYKISKAMLLRYVKDLARDFARHQISINAISPGMIDAGLAHLDCVQAMKPGILGGIPMNRYGEVTELFETIDLFLSGRAPFSTGNNVTVNGGAYMPSA